MFKIGDLVIVIKPDSITAGTGVWNISSNGRTAGSYNILPIDDPRRSRIKSMMLGEGYIYHESQLIHYPLSTLEKIIYGVVD